MKYPLNKYSITLFFALSIISCGGGGGGGDSSPENNNTPPAVETPPVTAEQITSVEDQLIEQGFGNFDELTPAEIEQGLGDFDDLSKTEVEAIEEALSPLFEAEEIEYIFEELEIAEPAVTLTEDPTSVFTANIIGLWELKDSNGASGTLISVGTKTISIYSPNTTDSCYDFSLYNIYADVENDFTIQSPLSDELKVITALGENEITYEGTSFEESTIDAFGSALLCEATSIQTVTVEIKLQDLEDQLKLIKNSDPVTSYRWQVFFDVNESGVYDSGDMNFRLQYDSLSDTPETGNYIDIDTSDPRLFFAYQNDDSVIDFAAYKKFVTSGTSLVIGRTAETGEVAVNLSTSTLTLTFDTSVNPMIAYITGATPIKVINLINHDANDSAEYGDLTPTDNDGPWNWTSEVHTDEYPAGESFAPSSNGLVHTDPSGDQIGESSWVDIESVTVTVTNP